jgi:DNA invertase Pin-like site-specific DNA recombinase
MFCQASVQQATSKNRTCTPQRQPPNENRISQHEPTGDPFFLRRYWQLVFQMIGAVAQFERSLIGERVKAGLENAKAKGKVLGRPPLRSLGTGELLKLRNFVIFDEASQVLPEDAVPAILRFGKSRIMRAGVARGTGG